MHDQTKNDIRHSRTDHTVSPETFPSLAVTGIPGAPPMKKVINCVGLFL
jgi:hypothetical protein